MMFLYENRNLYLSYYPIHNVMPNEILWH